MFILNPIRVRIVVHDLFNRIIGLLINLYVMTLKEFGVNLSDFPQDSVIIDEIRGILSTIDRRLPGKAYRKSVIEKLEMAGWSGKVSIDHSSRASVDGIRKGIGIVVQLGNHAAGVLPIFNLEYLYTTNRISAGVFVTQTFDQAVQRHSLRNVGTVTDGNYISSERLEPDLTLYSKFLKCPIIVIAMDKI